MPAGLARDELTFANFERIAVALSDALEVAIGVRSIKALARRGDDPIVIAQIAYGNCNLRVREATGTPEPWEASEREIAPPEWGPTYYYRTIPEAGIAILVLPMLGGKARLCAAQLGDVGPYDGFCYASIPRAIEAACVWSGEGDPLDGWHRHPHSGRRREGGDPSKEVVRR